jgi:tRNA threonylcarbamoyladenosine biosynthesis protein TsaE
MGAPFKGKEVVCFAASWARARRSSLKAAAGLDEGTPPGLQSSFTILNIYQARSIFHFDLYRLEKKADILDLGWEDYLDRGVVIVEWGERIPFDVDAIWVTIRKGKGDNRKIQISSPRR